MHTVESDSEDVLVALLSKIVRNFLYDKSSMILVASAFAI